MMANESADTPTVSVIVPCRNEVKTITKLLAGVRDQSYPQELIDIIIADGMSNDGTRERIAEFASENPNLAIQVIDNPTQTIPSALNRAVSASSGYVVVRLDAHSSPHPEYVERCIAALERTEAANVGGVWEIQPSGDGWMAQSIARAAAHPLGAGDARYRLSGEPGEVETVPFGAFRREWLDRVGPFNEKLHSNEDYEYNVRLRQGGGLIWFDPSIRSTYYARETLRALAAQYARYGFWKARMLRVYPKSIRMRQALPPLFVLAALALAASTPFLSLARALFSLQLGVYAAVVIGAGILEGIRLRKGFLPLGFPLATATMHIAWGLAFWRGLIFPGLKRR